jgi:hypothetical protein
MRSLPRRCSASRINLKRNTEHHYFRYRRQSEGFDSSAANLGLHIIQKPYSGAQSKLVFVVIPADAGHTIEELCHLFVSMTLSQHQVVTDQSRRFPAGREKILEQTSIPRGKTCNFAARFLPEL